MRYRIPSLNTLLGVTKAKRRLKKNLGVYEVTKYTNAQANAKRRLKRRVGHESELMKLTRFLSRLFK